MIICKRGFAATVSDRKTKASGAAKLAAVFTAIAFMSGCGGSSEPEDIVDNALEQLGIPVVEPVIASDDPVAPVNTGLISGVTSGSAVGEYYQGQPPQTVGTLVLDPLNDGSNVFIIAGGSTELNVVSAALFSNVYVKSDNNGYFLLALPEAIQSTSVVVSFSADALAAGQRQVDVTVGDAEGNVSGSQSLALQSVEVGTGEVQVSVSWDKPTDVDLWLTEPDGTRIYYAASNSGSGGSLDLDSNAACFIDNVNNENITYDGVTAPSGEYVVAVDYFSNCSVAEPTNYIVTVRADGVTNTYSGQLTPTNDFVEVTRFQVR